MPRHLFQVTVNLPEHIRNTLNNNAVFNPYVFVRNRLYHFLFHRFSILYAKVFSEFHRKLIEFSVLLVALFSFILLVYVHVVFVQTPIKCLEEYRGIFKKRDILRVEVLSGKGKINYTLEDSYFKEKAIRMQYVEGQARYFYADHLRKSENDELYVYEEPVGANVSIKGENALEAFNSISTNELQECNNLQPEVVIDEEDFHAYSEASIIATDPNDAFIMEFTLEYGYLRLRPAKRKDLNISVVFVILDPVEDTCFGGAFNKYLLDNFLGYDNVLLSSIKNMVEKQNTKGFVRNAVLEVEYIFINNWVNEKSFFTAAFVMLVFTMTISTLLRHSHHQIFVVVANIFGAVWPRNFIPTSGAPVLTVVLALVGMEAVMSDFFNDRSIALHIIVIIWFADLYDIICCQSTMSKRHWYRFFYLYHFLFYAYNYKFSGVYWPLTLTCSWLFTFHSMVYFFHHYELPRFLHRSALFNASRRNATRRRSRNNRHGNNNNAAPNNEAPAREFNPPPDQPEILEDNQLDINESNQPDQQEVAVRLVNEEVGSAAGYNPLSQSAAGSESQSPGLKCCNDCQDDCQSFHFEPGIDSGRHTCLKENPTTSVSTSEENSLEVEDNNDECHQKEEDEMKAFDDLDGPQSCELSSDEFSDARNDEKFVEEGLFNDGEMPLDKSEKRDLNADQNADEEENALHSVDENDLYSAELHVD